MATTDESLADENWPIVCTFLPKGWKEMARSTGALRRARDIPDAESLLRLLLMHVVNGYSLAETAARASQLGMELSAVAVFKRLRASEEWLRWLAEQQRGRQRLAVESQGRPVRAVDATTVSEPGSTGTDWRVHYVVNLANLQCDFFELTGVEGGETLRRIPVRAGDIMMGDRIYATPVGVAHVKTAQADIVVRLNRQSLPIFDAAENQLNVLRLFRKMKVGQIAAMDHAGEAPGRRVGAREIDRAQTKRGSHALGTAPPGDQRQQEAKEGQFGVLGGGSVLLRLDHAYE